MNKILRNSSYKTLFFSLLIGILIFTVACGGKSTSATSQTASTMEQPVSEPADENGVGPAVSMDDIGKDPISPELTSKGKGIYEVKCAACHSLGENRVVGPGWKKVTKRRTPQWIVNMVTNTEEMLNKDPEAQKQIEECMVRMPNQNLDIDDAKAVLDFMRKNDEGN
jgi:mono/diheme cytochrome c family protein